MMGNRICPSCGSKDTAKILWGMPAMTYELQEQIDNNKVYLGGCCILVPTPTHHCNTCQKDFGGNYFVDPTSVKELYFYIGGYFGISHDVYLNTETSGKQLTYRASEDHHVELINAPLDNKNTWQVDLNDQWLEFNRDLLRCYFIDWNDHYVDEHILDGTQWELKVTFDNGITIERSGSNAYPPHWGKLMKLFCKYGLPHMK